MIFDIKERPRRGIAALAPASPQHQMLEASRVMADRQYIPRPYRVKDLSGQVFGRLTAIAVEGRDKQNRAVWLCSCECGATKVVPSRHLVNGAIRSCGCAFDGVAAANGRKGGIKLRGPKSHLYNPSLTDEERLKFRNLPELRDWRKAVLARDGRACQLCGKSDNPICVHHLYSWTDYPLMRYDVDNGLTLCREHHRDFHNFMGGPRVPCTPGDYVRFCVRWYLDRLIEIEEWKASNA